MGKERIIDREVKRTQSLYELKEKTINQQGSYNLSLEAMERLVNLNIIKKINDDLPIKYKVSDDYKVVLENGIISLIGDEYKEIDNKVIFVYTEANDGTKKFQIKRADNNDESTKWFTELYNSNCEGANFSIDVDTSNKTIIFENVMPPNYYKAQLDLVEKEQNSAVACFDKQVYQEIYYGVPGTGKSKGITDIISKYYPNYEIEGSPNVFRITVHPEYTYFDFIGNTMPSVTKNANGSENITYTFKPGPFTQALKKAFELANDHMPVFLVIEEMSRGNIAAIFGDIFQLLDRKNGVSEYGIYNDLISKEVFNEVDIEIKMPNNLNILGTVNTSDQNVFVMDNAFKRRFDFKYVSTKPKLDKNIYSFELSDKTIEWNDFYRKFNDFVVNKMGLSEDKQIGQFYYNFDNNLSDEENYEKLCNKLLNYIWFDINSNVFDGESIIKPNIKSFEKAFEDLQNHINIFSDSFFNEF